MTTLIKKLAIAIAFTTNFFLATANNVVVSSVSRSGSTVSFNISWDNSWQTAGAFYDMQWIFIKWRTIDCASQVFQPWQHGLLSTTMSQHTIGSGLVAAFNVNASPNNTGIFIKRSAGGSGNISSTPITLTLLTPFPSSGATNVEVKVFAISMVRQPQKDFYLGDGTSSNSFGDGANLTAPYHVTSNSAITVGTSSGNLYASAYPPAGNIPVAYPKGYQGFNSMTAEVTQQMYADFLNTLTFRQSLNRFQPGINFTYFISGYWPYYNTLPGAVPDRACANLSFADLAAYLDWAALRPMTELEFEKTCRYYYTPTSGQYAWGTTTLNAIATPPTNLAQPCESVSNIGTNGVCNYNNGSVTGSLRVGFLGTSSGSPTRSTMGAGYTGCVELSGNVWEHVVNVDATGITYTGILGDGLLDVDGNANTSNWPLGGTSGTGYRGGAWFGGSVYLPISSRALIFLGDARYSNAGGRGVR